MMRRLIIVFISLLFFSHYAQAALDLELTQGINAALPIVVVPFANGKSAQVPGNETITQVINNDLNNSGQFRVISPSVMDQTPSTVSQVNFNLWRKKGGNDIVIGQVNALGADRYQVSFQLLSLYSDPAKTKEANENNATLLNQSFTVAKSGLRVLAHHISDLIYQKLTGVRGVFNTKIAYVLLQRNPLRPQQAIHQLMVSDMDGFNPQVLLKQKAPIMSPAWSPNGKQLAYVSFENHHAAIYVQNLATGQRRKVSDSPGINGAPAFSPNGQQLALVLTRTGNPKIYTLNLNTNQLTQITRGYSIDTEPAWSPDGKNLIFTSNRGGNPQIYDYNFASKQVQRLTFSGKYNARASFLPNDQGIVMMHRDDSMFSIARQNLQSGRVTELTAAGDDESPSVAPNGKMVIYATNYGGTGVLAMVSIDGRVKLRLPAQDGNVQDPAWSPFLNIS